MPVTGNHLPTSNQGVSQEWLRQLGFKANPFALRQAGLEEQLDEYFVEPPGFEEVRGPHTFLLFAPRGGGKTACRIMVEHTCRPYDRHFDVLAVPYYKALENLVVEMGYDWQRVGRDRHVEALLRQALRALCADLAFQDSLPIYADQLALLRGLIDRYVSDLLSPQNVLRDLRQAKALRGDLDLKKVLDAFDERRLREALGDALVPESKAGQIFVRLVDSPSLSVTGSPLDTLASVARDLGFRSFFIMVDGLDEFPLRVPDAEDQAALLLPLLSDSRLMEHSFLIFKFFLPTALFPTLQACGEIRLDRLLSRTVSWRDDALYQLLQQRLVAFSENRIESLKALFDDPGSVDDADAKLVRWASGSPRTLLELGDELLNVHCQQYESVPKLTEADLDAIEKRFQTEYAPQLIPPLRVDEKTRRVLIGDLSIAQSTSPTEFKLLWFLYQHADEIKSKDDIWREVYEYDVEGKSAVAIDSLVFRLRKKIERDSSNPVYLKTVRGKGYWLLNTDRGG